MTKKEIIEKWEQKLSELGYAISESWSATTDEYHPLRKEQKIIFEMLFDLKQLNCE